MFATQDVISPILSMCLVTTGSNQIIFSRSTSTVINITETCDPYVTVHHHLVTTDNMVSEVLVVAVIAILLLVILSM